MSDIAQVQAQLDQANANVKILNANIEAFKQMLNDAHNTALVARANLVLSQQTNQELAGKNKELQDKVLSLGARIIELTPKDSHDINGQANPV